MSSLGNIMNIASSGLLTSQTQLKTVSDNVSNVSTPGYIRKIADQQSAVSPTGGGQGVDIVQFRLAADRFLQAAGLSTAAASAGAKASSDTLDQAQSLFGDPTSSSSFLGSLDQVFSGFSSLAADPSAAARSAPLTTLQGFLDQAQGLSASLTQLGADADSQVSDKVAQANTLLTQINALNSDISRANVVGGDATGAQNQQSNLVDQLSQLVDVRVSPTTLGGVTLRGADGSLLVGPGAPPAVLSYDTSGSTGVLSLATNGGPAKPAGAAFTSGAIAALIKTRNIDLPGMGDQLASLTAGVSDALNAAHNDHSSVPAPATLSGRATALTQTEAFSGFTSGRTAVAVTNAAGVVTQRVDVDWAAGTLSVNGGAPTGFSPSTFVSSLNTALSPAGSASYSATGALTISAASGGVTVADDPAAQTLRAGKNFSGFFGLNDLVTSATPTAYATGLASTDTSGFTGDITLRISGASGEQVTDVRVTAPSPPATMADLVGALNDPSTGVGLYGAFALNPNGALAFTPRAGTGDSLSVVSDTTSRGTGGPSISGMFGIGEATRIDTVAARAVRPDIVANSGQLALATFDWSAGVGATALSAADDSGADALGEAGKATITFGNAGGLTGGSFGVSDYAAKVGADVARRASNAAEAQSSTAAAATAATDRRSSVEGVNLDEELVNLTTFQQSYNASARLISTVRDMYDTLISMVSN